MKTCLAPGPGSPRRPPRGAGTSATAPAPSSRAPGQVQWSIQYGFIFVTYIIVCYIVSSLCQWNTEVPLRRNALRVLRGPLGDAPPLRNRTSLGPCKAPEGTNTKPPHLALLAKQHVVSFIPVSVKKTFLRKIWHLGMSAFRAPNQRLESGFCCWTAGQGLAQKECCFFRHRQDQQTVTTTAVSALCLVGLVDLDKESYRYWTFRGHA